LSQFIVFKLDRLRNQYKEHSTALVPA